MNSCVFIELIDTCGNTRWVNPKYIKEIIYDELKHSWRIIFENSCSYFTDYNINKLIDKKYVNNIINKNK